MNHPSALHDQSFKEIYIPGNTLHPQGIGASGGRFGIMPLEPVLSAAACPSYETCHPFMFTLLIFTHGNGILNVDLCDYDVQQGAVLILYPGAAFQVKMNEGFRGYVISFAPDLFRNTDITAVPLLFRVLHHNFAGSVTVKVDEHIQKDILPVVCSMQQEYTKQGKGRPEIWRGLFLVFMTYLSRAADSTPYSFFYDKSMALPERFMALIKEHICTHKQVAGYAAMLCVTPGLLNSVMKRMTGHTASYHIYRHLLLEAKKKAVFTGDSMKEIAAALGFTDVYHFSKFFRKNAGINFSSFRRESVPATPKQL